MRKLVFTVLITLAFVRNASAWNTRGHEIVAYIAYEQMDSATRAKVDALVQKNPCITEWTADVSSLPANQQSVALFMLSATWPDMIRTASGPHAYKCQPGHTFVSDGSGGGDIPPPGTAASQNIGFTDTAMHKYWHFIDLPFSTDGTTTTSARHPNALTQIIKLRTALASSEDADLKSYDLAWLTHLVGDVHQPLHDTARFTKNHCVGTPPKCSGDNGGNLVIICTTPKCKSELHAYWDGLLGSPDASLSSTIRVAKALNARPKPAGADSANVNSWVTDGRELAKSHVYIPPISDDEPGSVVGVPDSAYHDQAKTLAQSQVLLAGYRLKALVSTALK
jgi:hypothetical protein